MAGEADHDTLILQLLEFVPSATPELASQYLSANHWDLDAAAASMMADMEEQADDAAGPASSAQTADPPEYTGPRTLDGRPAPEYASSNSSKKKEPKRRGLATLSSLGGGHEHDSGDDEDDSDHGRGPRDTYAGGEKSGLAIQDPTSDARRLAEQVVAKAKSRTPRPEADPQAGPSSASHFRGTGHSLGGEGVPSRTIPDPRGTQSPAHGSSTAQGQVQERTLHLWDDGFSIDDGPLYSYSDPANADAMRMITQGRAPVHLMNVRYDEPIDVKLQQHQGEKWKQLPKVYKPFSGQGRRLGSPVPGDSSAHPPPAAPAPSTLSSSTSSTTAPPDTSVDPSQPTIMIRIQMPDGSRLPARFNTTHTVNDVYEFITRSSPVLGSGGWVLATTFPNKEHTDKSLVLGEMNEFKKGGTAVVKRV